MSGYVYIIRRAGSRERKVGVARRHPANGRLRQLQTGCPEPLVLERAFRVRDPFGVEAQVHRRLSQRHYRAEWFTVDLHEAERAVRDAAQGRRTFLRWPPLWVWFLAMWLFVVIVVQYGGR